MDASKTSPGARYRNRQFSFHALYNPIMSTPTAGHLVGDVCCPSHHQRCSYQMHRRTTFFTATAAASASCALASPPSSVTMLSERMHSRWSRYASSTLPVTTEDVAESISIDLVILQMLPDCVANVAAVEPRRCTSDPWKYPKGDRFHPR